MVEALQEWLAAASGWAPLVVFVITFPESLPGISLLVPSTVLLLATGALMGAGTLEPVPVVTAAIAGAIAGDAVGFWLSRAYGTRLVRRILPRSQRRGYARTLVLFRRFGWAAVFFGRFLGPARAVAPLIAGVARMRERHFQLANIASAIIWAPLILFPDYAAARGVDEAGLTQNQVMGGLVAVGVAMIGWHLVRRWRVARKARTSF